MNIVEWAKSTGHTVEVKMRTEMPMTSRHRFYATIDVRLVHGSILSSVRGDASDADVALEDLTDNLTGREVYSDRHQTTFEVPPLDRWEGPR